METFFGGRSKEHGGCTQRSKGAKNATAFFCVARAATPRTPRETDARLVSRSDRREAKNTAVSRKEAKEQKTQQLSSALRAATPRTPRETDARLVSRSDRREAKNTAV